MSLDSIIVDVELRCDADGCTEIGMAKARISTDGFQFVSTEVLEFPPHWGRLCSCLQCLALSTGHACPVHVDKK